MANNNFGNARKCMTIILKIGTYKKPIHLSYIALSMSDLSLSAYLVVIAVVNEKFTGNFIEYDYKWRYSIYCKLTGIFASNSILYTNICLLIITIDRSMAICSPITHRHLNYRFLPLFLILFYVLVSFISSFPFLIYKVNITRFLTF